MDEKLSWNEIEKRYDQEWVQLVAYDWPEGTPYPRSGVVRVHASTRKEFNSLISAKDTPKDAARLYVGRPIRNPHTVISCNTVRISRCE